MDTLIELMKKILADTFALYLKTHNYHWNVEGPDFPQFHAFFGTLYEELHDSVDPIAEHIRTLNSYVPGSLSRFSQLTDIADQIDIPECKAMISNLLNDNTKIIQTLNIAHKLADEVGEYGLSNFLQDRIDVHKKYEWQFKSILK